MHSLAQSQIYRRQTHCGRVLVFGAHHFFVWSLQSDGKFRLKSNLFNCSAEQNKRIAPPGPLGKGVLWGRENLVSLAKQSVFSSCRAIWPTVNGID